MKNALANLDNPRVESPAVTEKELPSPLRTPRPQARMNRRLARALVVLLVVAPSFGQKQAKHSEPLAKPMDWGTYSSRLFKDSRKVRFSLATSWIPGENHKGMMRYKMGARPDDPTASDDLTFEATELLMRRTENCIITLNLFDSDNFLLRQAVVPFGLGVDDQGRVIALHANSSIQMDAQEYRKFAGTPPDGGSWNVSWACGTP